MPEKHPATDRHHGGPGSSQQDAKKPEAPREAHPHPGEPTNPDRSRVSGGGGERDRHHSHDPLRKS
jgi:hypothetical protein